MLSPSHEEDVPVTGAFLSFVRAMHAARTLYNHEAVMAQALQVSPPRDPMLRCESLFTHAYALYCELIGLKRNRITFDAIMNMVLPDELNASAQDPLLSDYLFSPSTGRLALVKRHVSSDMAQVDANCQQ